MWIRKLIIGIYLFFCSVVLLAQDEHPFDCKNFRIGQRYTGQQLTIRLRTIKKDFEVYSAFGYFDKALEVLNGQLESYDVPREKRKQIISQIKEMCEWPGEKLQKFSNEKTQNSELLTIYNNYFDITNITKVDFLTFTLPMNYVIEKYLSKEKAKEVIEGLLTDNYNCKCAISYLEENFCFYQRAGTIIEGYGAIDKRFKDYHEFLKDYLK